MYALFEWDTYYPCGGWNDHVATMDTDVRALAWMNRDGTHTEPRPACHAQIVNLTTSTVLGVWERSVVYTGTHPPGLSAPEHWTYPEDEHGTVYWKVGPWERA